jgi:hypothetical protein
MHVAKSNGGEFRAVIVRRERNNANDPPVLCGEAVAVRK